MYRYLKCLAVLLLVGTRTVMAQPVANFTVDATERCPKEAFTFTNLSTGATSYLWEFSVAAPNTSTVANPQWIFYNPGVYTVKLTAYNGSQSNTLTKTAYIKVHDTAAVDFSGSVTSGCVPLVVNFTNSTVPLSGNTYQWVLQGGSPTIASGTSASTTYNVAGNYLVTLKATTAKGCISSITKTNYISAKPKPSVSFTGSPLDFCGTTGKVSFTSSVSAGTAPYTYLWSFGSITANPTNITFNSPPSQHNVHVVVTDANGCKDTALETGYVKLVEPVADFQAPASVCIYSPVTFINKTSPCVTSAWWSFDYPNGLTSIANNPIFAYTTPGLKIVKMITWCGNCPDTVTKTIMVYDLPVVDFVSKPDTPCPAPVAVQYIPNGTYTSYNWTFGSLAAAGPPTSTAASPTRNYTANGFDTVMLTVTDANGCTNMIKKEPATKIFDYHRMLFAWDKDTLCAPINYKSFIIPQTRMNQFGVVDGLPHNYPWGYKSIEWTAHDGTKQYTDTFRKLYTYADSFRISVKIITNNNCLFGDSTKAPIGTKPAVSHTAPSRICRRDSIILLNTAPYPHNEYRWDYGDGTPPGPAKDGFHEYEKPGTYVIKHTNFYNGCPSDTILHTVVVDSPKAGYDRSFFCHKDSTRYVKVEDQSMGADSVYYLWGDGQTSSSRDTIHLYPGPGTYILRQVAYNKTANCWDTSKPATIVNIFDAEIDVVANDTAVCLEDMVYLTAVPTGFTPLNYTWFLDGSMLNPAWEFNFPTLDTQFFTKGFHSVKLTVQDEHACLHSVTKNNYIFVSRPAVSFTANPLNGCVPMTTTLTDQSTVPTGATITNRLWTVTGGAPSPISTSNGTTSTTYLNAGSYPVKLVVTDNVGCKDSSEVQGFINAFKPLASFTVSDTGCLNTPLTFTNNSLNFNSALWDFGNGTSGTINPSRSFSSLGSYDITLIVSDNLGCKDTAKKKLAITKPYPAFTVSDSVAVCSPFIVSFTNNTTGPNSGNNSYWWDFGNGSSTVPNPVNAYINPGVYNITMIATTPWGCQDSVKSTVRLYGYSGALDYFPKVGCVPLEVTFAPVDLYNIPKLTWDFTDGNIFVTTLLDTTKHTYLTAGKYLPKLILEDMNGCKATSMGLDSIVVDETYADFTTGPACEYGSMDFFDQSKGKYSAITTWNWVFDTSGASIQKNPTHGYGPAGQYPVILAVKSANQCTDTIEKVVNINPLPVIDAGPDTTICLTDSALLLPNGGVSYKWTPASYLNCDTCVNPLASPPKQFVYTVVGTDANGCKNKDTVTVNIKTKVTADVGPGTEICDLDTFRMKVWGARTYEWKPAESLDNSASANPLASPHITTNYIVVAYEGSCIPDTHNVKVVVHPLPTVKAEGGTTIVAGNTADLRASGERIKRFEWLPAENLTCEDCAFPTAKPQQTTIYTVKVFTDFGCVDSDKVTIMVLCDQSQLFIPNTFTPNGDGQNDIFYPRGTGMDKVRSFRVYNRWGEAVFERTAFNLNDQFSGWDGTFRGKELPPDVFVWVLDALCDDGKVLTLKGDVTIIR